VIKGSPFYDHQGEIRLRAMGGETEVTWTIRFRSRAPFMGRLWRILLQRMLDRTLTSGLKRYVEGAASVSAKVSTSHPA